MNWLWQADIGLLSLRKNLDAFDSFFPDNLFLSLRQLKDFPADLLIILIVALEIRPNVGDDFRGLVLLYQPDNAQDIEYLGYEVFQVEVLLLIHEGFHHFFDAALGYCFLLVDKTIENFG